MATKLPRLSVTPPSEEVLSWIEEVAALTYQAPAAATGALLAAMHDLGRSELRRIQLTEHEADCLADVLNGSVIALGPILGPIVYAEVSDAFHLAGDGISSYGAKHDIDQDALLAKLRGIGPSADLALRLAFARWWNMPDRKRDYRAVGLNIKSQQSITEID
ncbi:hypothetical protein F0Q45_12730 [Mycobacterium simiae]|uniref:Uncharacterized protein n=1 Tax=Mycobacterium simiae TaxID=1784 RepID=A0A5B1BRK5_MYCSI|nr:hypothetical protein [Mycobacterium simiae]KAA1249864.1 hypothetical protein F0Q45_12730 [Mycobacterium simiae]